MTREAFLGLANTSMAASMGMLGVEGSTPWFRNLENWPDIYGHEISKIHLKPVPNNLKDFPVGKARRPIFYSGGGGYSPFVARSVSAKLRLAPSRTSGVAIKPVRMIGAGQESLVELPLKRVICWS